MFIGKVQVLVSHTFKFSTQEAEETGLKETRPVHSELQAKGCILRTDFLKPPQK